MKLLYITNKITGVGGIQRVLSVKASYLAENYNVTILATNQSGNSKIEYPLSPEVNTLTINPKRSLFFYFLSYKKLIQQAVAQINPDVVVMCDNGIKSFLLPLIIKHVPLVYESHTTKQNALNENKGLANIAYKITARLIRKFDAVVALTKTGAAEFNTFNVHVIPNPLWINAVEESALSAKKLVVLGRHNYQKGFDRLFEAWKIISAKHPDWVIEIYGEDNPDYDIKAMAAGLNLERVIFKKPVQDIAATFSNASINLLPSRYEGFGLVIIEAAAFGVPTVAFNCPVGPGEIITNHKDGLLIPDGDIKAFAKGVCLLIENPPLRKELGAEARIMSQRYAIAPVMAQWDNLFTSLKRTKIA
jgi:glycosyltransferase involved in cell wall biosynthesis